MRDLQEELEYELDWVDDLDNDLESMIEDLTSLEDQIQRLEFEFRASFDPDVYIQLSRARRVYFVTLDTVDFLIMNRKHRLEWHLQSLRGKG